MRSIIFIAVAALAGCQTCVESKPSAEQTGSDEQPITMRNADGGRAFKLRNPPLVRDLGDASAP